MLTSLFPRAHARYASLSILGGVLDELCSWLHARGFPPHAIRRHLEAAPFLDAFLRRRHIRSLGACTAVGLRACLPRQKRWRPQTAYALGRSLLTFLQERGELTSITPTRSEQLIDAYRGYLQRVRGLAPRTARHHVTVTTDFLRFLKYDDRSDGLQNLHVAEIEAFVTAVGARVCRITMQSTVAILGSFLRFLATRGDAATGLALQIESPRQYRGERLARALPWDAVLSLLRAIDRSTVKGHRDYAMLLLIATYGLRASEIAALHLDDVMWRARIIRVPRPKIGTPLAVPLTDDVATALLDYLRCQSRDVSHRQLFLRVRVPRGPITAAAVSDAFDAWAVHAGVRVPTLGGPHCLRHSLAMHLLRQGTPLKTIGDLLGHRSVESTGIYLRLHLQDLRDVALSLPMTAIAPTAEVPR
jgi:integrase/recombinase XerD